MRVKLLILFCVFIRCIHLSYAQTFEVNGIVVDELSEPIIGASVLVKETKQAVVTDVDGCFKLLLPASGTKLTVSYIGYQTVELPAKRNMNIQLAPMATQLNEVVVTGIFNKPKESYTGAAVMVTSKELQEAGNRNLISSIANVVPGFRITENLLSGSNPNSIPQVSVRGTTNIASDLTGLQSDAESIAEANLPLVVMNGFEISLERMMDLDENQVESITILKDASATAMYGTKGSNGVIVITTKKPEQGKIRITYKGTLDWQVADLGSYNLMNAREKFEYEVAAGLYSNNSPDYTQALEDIYNSRKLQVERGVDTYWIKFPVHNAVGHRHYIGVDGGTENLRYGGSVAYRNNEGAMRGNSRNTFDGNMFLQYDVNNFSFQNDLYITHVKAEESNYGSFDTYTKLNQYLTPYNEDGTYKQLLENTYYYSLGTSKVYNPLYNASLPSRNNSKYTQIQNNFSVEWHILPEFFVRGKFGITTFNQRSDVYKSAAHTDFADYSEEDYERKGTYTYTPYESTSWETQLTANYAKKFNEKHQVFAGIGVNFDEYKMESYTIEAEGLSVLTMDFLGQAASYKKNSGPSGSETKNRSAGFVFNGTYSYNNRYTLDLNGKYEGSSKFGKNSRYNYFWSVGTGWNIHHEEFMKKVKWVDYARLKLSYGVTGDPIKRNNQSLRTYTTTSGASYQGWYGVYINSYGNPDLKMAKTGQLNLGMDLELFERRIRLSADVYEKRTKDMILTVDLPTSSGFSSYYANVGEVSNKGFELTGTFVPVLVKEKDFRIEFGGTMSHVVNKLKKISNALDDLSSNASSDDVANPSMLYQEGESINTIYAVRSKGIDPASGREIFMKRNGDETFEWDAADRVGCGKTDPKIEGTLNVSARYRGFNMSAYFSYRLGGQAYNSSLASKVENIKPYNNADRRALTDRWKQPGDHALYKAIDDFSTTKATSRFVMDNDVFQLSTLNVGYDVPQAWSRTHIGIPYISIKATLSDLFYKSTIKRERGTSTPFSRQYSLALTLRF